MNRGEGEKGKYIEVGIQKGEYRWAKVRGDYRWGKVRGEHKKEKW